MELQRLLLPHYGRRGESGEPNAVGPEHVKEWTRCSEIWKTRTQIPKRNSVVPLKTWGAIRLRAFGGAQGERMPRAQGHPHALKSSTASDVLFVVARNADGKLGPENRVA